MGVYLQLSSKRNEPEDLASNTGWGDVGRWVESLPPHTADHLMHLWLYGWQDELSEMNQQIEAAMKAHAPTGDVVSVLTNLMTLAEQASKLDPPLVQVTNGMIEVDEDDEEAEDEE